MIAKFAGACALIALCVQPLAAQSACITKDEMRAGLTLMMPTVIETVQVKCKPSLPETAYLIAHGSDLLTRYGKGDVQDTAALTSLLKKVDLVDTSSALPVEAITPLLSAIASDVITKEIKSETCPMIDKVFALLDPMPRENMFGLIELFVSTVAKPDPKKRGRKQKASGFTICEASAS
jgi:hypothetical protein